MFIIVVVAIYGVIVGSGINALVWRLHTKQSWVRGRSMCPDCRHELAVRDLVPLVSWATLRGRCRYCHKPISWQYPAVELATGTLYGLSAYQLHPAGLVAWAIFVLWLVVLALFMAMVVTDLRWMLLLDRLTYPAAALAGIMVLVRWAASPHWHSLASPILAGAAAAGCFYLIAVATRGKGMGGGDIKLVFVIGLLLGWERTLLALFIAFNTGAIVGLGLLAAQRIKSHLLPFGPFLIGATMVAYLYGRELIGWYLQLSGLTG